VHFPSLFTNETPLALVALAPFSILIVKKLKNVLQLLHVCNSDTD